VARLAEERASPRSAALRFTNAPTWIYLIALAAVAVLSRLPQLLSRNLLLEGDECVLGLMGMHVAQGRDFPVFFYGQKYGLAIVEAPAAALSFLIAGAGPVSLKIAILAVWIVGVGFYFLAFAPVLGAARSFLITLLLVLMPAWAAASMKAWSGYVTAFSATAVVLYLITQNDNRRAVWLAAGAVTGIIYYSHPLWLPGLTPLVLYFLVMSRRLTSWLAYGAGALAVAAAIAAIKALWLTGAVQTWIGPTAGNPNLFASLPRLLNQLYVDLTGAYYFGTPVHVGPVTSAVAYLWLALLGAAVILQIYRIAARKHLIWSHLLFLSVIATLLANWILLDWRDARYVLAVNVPLVFLCGVELFDFVDRYHVSFRRCAAAICLVLALEAVSMNEFARYTYMWWTNSATSPSEARTLRKVIDSMRSRGVTHAYAMNALLQWTITFYSRETVIARWKADRDRYPPYVAEIDRALDAGEPVAIVGYVGYTYGLEQRVPDPQAIVNVDGKYFVYFGVGKDLLWNAGFRLSR
jgi:hypothetical protein